MASVSSLLNAARSVGELELSCQIVQDAFQSHSLLVYTATPGSPSHERLRLLAATDAPVG